MFHMDIRARDLILFTIDLQTINYYTIITARADLFLKLAMSAVSLGIIEFYF